MRIRSLRVRRLTGSSLLGLAILALVITACSEADVTRAGADDRLGSAVQDPADVDTSDPGRPDADDATTVTDTDAGEEAAEDAADDEDAADQPDDTDTDEPDGDSEETESDDPEAEADNSADDSDDSDDSDQDEDFDQDAAGTPLTGPGSATAASAETLVPVGREDSGEEVLALQRRLDELGFAPGTPDGSYGRRTVAAVEAFQDLVDLESTGIADAETINALVTYRYDGLVLHAGDEGDAVEELQLRLTEGPFDPGGVDGSYGTGTVQAVWALEKMAGIPVDGDWGPLDEKAWEQLTAGEIGGPEKDHDERWVEVDLSQQIMKVYDPGASVPTLVSHASSGSGIPWENEEHRGSSVTPVGDFKINRRISGWRESSLNIGRLYNPLYFNGGIAFHGASSVPLYPASHGCIRLPMHVADYLPDELPNGTPVHILK